MDKQTIQNTLKKNHQSFTDLNLRLSESDFLFTQNEKWTAGQQFEHIYLSVKPLAQALILPKFALKLIFGTANRQGKNYDELIKKYLLKLENGGRASQQFMPKPVKIEQRQKLSEALTKQVEKLCLKVEKFSEEELDKYILPHPLLGKLTIREMLYFTIYHVKHHEEQTKKNLKK